MTDPIRPFFDSLAGKRIPGGCAECNAEQCLEELTPNVWSLVIAHDARCPVLRTAEAGSN